MTLTHEERLHLAATLRLLLPMVVLWSIGAHGLAIAWFCVLVAAAASPFLFDRPTVAQRLVDAMLGGTSPADEHA